MRMPLLWNCPASMNLFCVGLLIDALTLTVRGSVLPRETASLFSIFGAALAVKQIANALRLLGAAQWDRTGPD